MPDILTADAAVARKPRTGRDSPLFVGSLEKGLRVLSAFDETHRTLRLTEIAGETGLDKSAAQRFTHTLYQLGYLRKDPKTKHYSLAPKVLELGFTYLRTDALVERATPFLMEANRESEETVNLTELDGTEVVYVARVPSRHVISVDVILGTWLPAYCSAPGRAILSALPEAEARALLAASEMVRYTPHTIADTGHLMEEIAKATADGFAITVEEHYVGDLSIAAPVLDFSGRPVAAVNIAVPTGRWTVDRMRRQLGPIVKRTAAEISRTEGGQQPDRSTHFPGRIAVGRRAPSKAA
ncbi:MAG: helix-turn-helix domain-containing protein [Rhodospirillaceae bacterium]|nr:helix-turn-helix domain-containing protein [Rhodospirillaceae bacterium]